MGGATVDNTSAFHNAVLQLKPGSPVTLTYRRGGVDRSVIVAPGTAEELAGRLLRADPQDAPGFRERGKAFHYLGNDDAAIADLSKAISLDPKDAAALDGLGLAQTARKDHDQAIAALTEAIRLDPRSATAYRNCGNSVKALGDSARAEGYYKYASYLEAQAGKAK
jgi:tetratricopeptide (TPR) repeat protein